MERVDSVVIGAGVVGLAVARALALRGRSVWLLEAEAGIGTGVSSRNSEVIHAGIYYPAGSLKAQFCVEGREALYAYCAERGIGHRRCGKLLVATLPEQTAALEQVRSHAAANGVHDLQWLTRDEALALEPALHCHAALLSPSSGIVDSHALMLALLGDAENAGATAVFNCPVLGATVVVDGIVIDTGGAEPVQLLADRVVNSAGLSAPAFAQRIAGLPPECAPTPYYAKGNYYSLTTRAPFRHLIYPLPEPGGLGVHLTLDLAGHAKFGPDVQWVDAPDYRVDLTRLGHFETEIRKYWPGLPDAALQPDYVGIRPKISGPGEPAADFVLSGPRQHGVAGLVNLLGIESPGLTSALAIGRSVAEMLGDS